MQDIHQILKQYWGYDNFRPMQEEIIRSALDGNDTLALLPTGGGKSICFQVPAMAQEGICLVISPLIALMKDQVDNLQKLGINAIAVNSMMKHKEIDTALDNCVYGDVKFLYVSPERLQTDMFRARLPKMKVNILAVDEAHCISQWGYDFRPPYLEIAEIRELIPDTPILALTATATPDVVGDIQEKLKFKKPNLFQQSFERKNLAYVVLYEDDKNNRLLKVINNVKGSGIVYARSRRLTRQLSDFLRKNKISADYYHAGLSPEKRNAKQNEWISNKTRVMCATNAFGMGIDKPDVRFVVHMDPADTLEAYFQEAGRAGRDQKKSYAVMLTNSTDLLEFRKKIEHHFPAKADIKQVYNALGNFLQLAHGSGKDVFYDFEITEFCERYHFNPLLVINCLRFLEKEGYIITTDSVYMPSRVKIISNKMELYKMQVKNKKADSVVKVLLRSYAGLFDEYTKIQERQIAYRAGMKQEQVIAILHRLREHGLIDYVPQNNLPQISFNQGRLTTEDLHISKENYEQRKKVVIGKMKAVLNYLGNKQVCRSRLLLSYFGEYDVARCGQCDVCLERNKLRLSDADYEKLVRVIREKLEKNPLNTQNLVDSIRGQRDDLLLKTIRHLIDSGQVREDEAHLLHWKE